MTHSDIKNKMMCLIATSIDLSIMTCVEAIQKLEGKGELYQLDTYEQEELCALRLMKVEITLMKNNIELASIKLNEKIREQTYEMVRKDRQEG